VSPLLGPAGSVAPGVRQPFGATGMPGPWNAFAPADLQICYPKPAEIDRRLRNYPQQSVGNALRDPLPVPFTAEEVKAALLDVYRHRKTRPDDPSAPHCARASPLSVHVALLVLPILESRNGGWIDFDAGRPATEPPGSGSPTPRAGVVNLRCMLYGLVGKPIPPRYAGSCLAQQPRRLEALYNIRDVRSTLTGLPPIVLQGDEWLGLQPNDRAVPFRSEQDLCPTSKCPNTVRICERCWDKSEIGTFIYGTIAGAMGFNWPWTFKGLVFAHLKNPEKFGLAPTSPDTAAADLGQRFDEARRRGELGVDDLCEWIKKQGNRIPAPVAQHHGDHGNALDEIARNQDLCNPCSSTVPKGDYHPDFPRITRKAVTPTVGLDGKPRTIRIGLPGFKETFFDLPLNDFPSVQMPREVLGKP